MLLKNPNERINPEKIIKMMNFIQEEVDVT